MKKVFISIQKIDQDKESLDRSNAIREQISFYKPLSTKIIQELKKPDDQEFTLG